MAQAHMTKYEREDWVWKEEVITDLLLGAATPRVRAYPFNRTEEGGEDATGADWLWWWIDPDGTSFGMLVQAKRMKKRPTKAASWDIDFAYQNGLVAQREQLRNTAEKLQVAAAYVLYFGSPTFTAGIPPTEDDPHLKHPNPRIDRELCEKCARKTVGFLPAHLARDYTWRDAPKAYVLSRPIEDLAFPRKDLEAPLVLGDIKLSDKLRAFLTQRQEDAKHAAKSLLLPVLHDRIGQFNAGVAEQVGTSSDNQVTDAPFFESLPDDRDHSGRPYFAEILRGLRTAPPAYVLNLLYGENADITDQLELNPEELAGIAGVVVVHCGDPQPLEHAEADDYRR